MGIIFIFSVYSKWKSLSWWAWDGDPDMSHEGSIFLLEMLLSHRQMAFCEQSLINLSQHLQHSCKQVSGHSTLMRNWVIEGRGPSACLWLRETVVTVIQREMPKPCDTGGYSVLWCCFTVLHCSLSFLDLFSVKKNIYMKNQVKSGKVEWVLLAPETLSEGKKKNSNYFCARDDIWNLWYNCH